MRNSIVILVLALMLVFVACQKDEISINEEKEVIDSKKNDNLLISEQEYLKILDNLDSMLGEGMMIATYQLDSKTFYIYGTANEVNQHLEENGVNFACKELYNGSDREKAKAAILEGMKKYNTVRCILNNGVYIVTGEEPLKKNTSCNLLFFSVDNFDELNDRIANLEEGKVILMLIYKDKIVYVEGKESVINDIAPAMGTDTEAYVILAKVRLTYFGTNLEDAMKELERLGKKGELYGHAGYYWVFEDIGE